MNDIEKLEALLKKIDIERLNVIHQILLSPEQSEKRERLVNYNASLKDQAQAIQTMKSILEER